ncbi:MAG: DUF131 domain-containing protein [Methanosarcinales archaeon]
MIINLLIPIGIFLVFIGFILIFFEFIRQLPYKKVEGGGLILIGPIPIVFGSDTRYVILAIILVIILMLIVFYFSLSLIRI